MDVDFKLHQMLVQLIAEDSAKSRLLKATTFPANQYPVRHIFGFIPPDMTLLCAFAASKVAGITLEGGSDLRRSSGARKSLDKICRPPLFLQSTIALRRRTAYQAYANPVHEPAPNAFLLHPLASKQLTHPGERTPKHSTKQLALVQSVTRVGVPLPGVCSIARCCAEQCLRLESMFAPFRLVLH
mmetsp:Transcript_73119/g.141435  ORF Transcript_73119/g.141435 Transcript_73119/m.141435 type:complete len:185 (-) Transcript_73119:1305-1859(-)